MGSAGGTSSDEEGFSPRLQRSSPRVQPRRGSSRRRSHGHKSRRSHHGSRSHRHSERRASDQSAEPSSPPAQPDTPHPAGAQPNTDWSPAQPDTNNQRLASDGDEGSNFYCEPELRYNPHTAGQENHLSSNLNGDIGESSHQENKPNLPPPRTQYAQMHLPNDISIKYHGRMRKSRDSAVYKSRDSGVNCVGRDLSDITSSCLPHIERTQNRDVMQDRVILNNIRGKSHIPTTSTPRNSNPLQHRATVHDARLTPIQFADAEPDDFKMDDPASKPRRNSHTGNDKSQKPDREISHRNSRETSSPLPQEVTSSSKTRIPGRTKPSASGSRLKSRGIFRSSDSITGSELYPAYHGGVIPDTSLSPSVGDTGPATPTQNKDNKMNAPNRMTVKGQVHQSSTSGSGSASPVQPEVNSSTVSTTSTNQTVLERSGAQSPQERPKNLIRTRAELKWEFRNINATIDASDSKQSLGNEVRPEVGVSGQNGNVMKLEENGHKDWTVNGGVGIMNNNTEVLGGKDEAYKPKLYPCCTNEKSRDDVTAQRTRVTKQHTERAAFLDNCQVVGVL